MNAGTRNPLQTAVVLLSLSAAYWLAGYFVADFSGGTGARWANALQTLAGWPRTAAPVLLSAIGAIGLLIIAVPLAGIIAVLYPPRAVRYALLVATPATASLLADVLILRRMGLQIPAAALALVAADASKTLLIPPLLALLLRRWLPRRHFGP